MASCASNTEKGPKGKDSSCSNRVPARMEASCDKEGDTSDKADKMVGISSSYDNHNPMESQPP